jgi:hypothetical protein
VGKDKNFVVGAAGFFIFFTFSAVTFFAEQLALVQFTNHDLPAPIVICGNGKRLGLGVNVIKLKALLRTASVAEITKVISATLPSSRNPFFVVFAAPST